MRRNSFVILKSKSVKSAYHRPGWEEGSTRLGGWREKCGSYLEHFYDAAASAHRG